ncbi:hypothetical protein ACN9MB_13040 [Dyella kyungheensis]|uniref:hypothetical protein n=1 Tax=Dyella kyungheensis TaxID=1242174 RepID=UPI003CFB5149
MTAFDYPNTAATATRLLKRFGAACTIMRESGTAYDSTSGTVVPNYDSLPSTAVVIAMPQRYIDNTLILQGDQQAFCAPDVEPKQGDQFVWQGKTFSVISVKPVSPAGVPVLFEAQLRG